MAETVVTSMVTKVAKERVNFVVTICSKVSQGQGFTGGGFGGFRRQGFGGFRGFGRFSFRGSERPQEVSKVSERPNNQGCQGRQASQIDAVGGLGSLYRICHSVQQGFGSFGRFGGFEGLHGKICKYQARGEESRSFAPARTRLEAVQQPRVAGTQDDASR
jgi:hypothetical protein